MTDFILMIVWMWTQSASSPAMTEPTVAMIDGVSCDATLRTAGSTRAEPIAKQFARGTYLHSGDEVRCTSSGRLTLILNNGGKREITAANGPFVVSGEMRDRSRAAAVPERQREMEARVAEVLRHHGRRAGQRGNDESQRVIAPASGAVVWPGHFVIRWSPQQVPGKVRLALWRSGDTAALWTENDVDGRSGTLDSADANAALAKASQAYSHPQQVFMLQFADLTGTAAVPFHVLSPQDTQALERDLEFWEEQDEGLLRLLGRAYAFDRRRLFLEAADEYRAAFDLTKSCDMLNEAIAASQRAQDHEQVRRLTPRRSEFDGGCADRYR